ncbi:MAG: selenocysteine-specific translation elongation factor [Synergistaceae bacterium]|nr:selenocysteine-specific translation elongation factor [Synergistaceae bacterium]
MNNVIVGTAGHVDHGKTSLIKALTGINADRLKEEQKRGITIELGFADMRTPDGVDIGIIDVPGHEKFIKNMLAGIGGIDMVLLVVAADEGVMPQTVEHLDIMSLLNIKKGIIVITKTDIVEPGFVELVEEDIREAVKGTFLEEAPVRAVSAVKGEGIDELRQLIYDYAKETGSRNNNPALLRIPIDRVFTISGFGTVITGTLTEGMIKTGQDIMIYPQGISAKVRNLQVHGQMVDAAYAGQRTAVNLQNVKKEEISRGNVLAACESLEPSLMADVKLCLLADSKRVVKNGARLHFYYGSEETLCKAVLFETQQLEPGKSCYAQLRFENAVVLKQGDPFVVRYYSPLETIGGGVVLNPNAPKHKSTDNETAAALKVRENGDDIGRLEQLIKDGSASFVPLSSIAGQLGLTDAEVQEHAKKLLFAGKAVKLTDTIFVHSVYTNMLAGCAAKLLREYHAKNPLLAGMFKEEFKNKLAGLAKIKNTKCLEAIIRFLADTGAVKMGVNSVSAPDFKVVYSKSQLKAMEKLKQYYADCGCEAPELDDAIRDFTNKQEGRHLLLAMEAEGILTRLSGNSYISTDVLAKIIETIKSGLAENGSITLAEVRDKLGTSRKYALQILEYCDRIKLTRLDGESRVLY